jgi:DNA-binding transcriptional LysR family regulator
MEPDRWLGVELRHFLALEAVAREGSFGKAAAALGYTQSAVSQQVASLERAVGAPLLERPGGPRRLRLTPVGESLVVHARAVVARLLAAQADIAAIRAGERGTLRVGTMQSVGTKVLPRLLSRFRDERPGIALVPLETFDHAELARAVETGRFDLSFAPMPVVEGPFAVRRILDDPFVLLAPSDSPLAGSTSVTLRQVARLPLIGFADPDLQGELVRHLQRTGQEPDIVFRSNDNPTVQGFVAAGPAARRHLARRPAAPAVGAPLQRAGGRGLCRPQPWLAAGRRSSRPLSPRSRCRRPPHPHRGQRDYFGKPT